MRPMANSTGNMATGLVLSGLGTILGGVNDQFGWTRRSAQLQERRLLRWGSPIFHYGTFAAMAATSSAG